MTSPAAARKRQQRATRPKHSRGEQARQLILEATLRVIARGGHRSITHRAVAAEAGINLSLVNYYFRGLDDLLLQAFEHVTERGRPAIESTWQEVWASLAPSQRGDLRRRDRRESLCRRLTDIAVRYVSHQSREYPEGLVLEMTALYDTNINPRLRELAHRYRADLA
ncbi:MAG: TetR family transcriptional regulator, partial [Haliea sp.]